MCGAMEWGGACEAAWGHVSGVGRLVVCVLGAPPLPALQDVVQPSPAQAGGGTGDGTGKGSVLPAWLQ